MPDGDCTGPRWKKGRRNYGGGRGRNGYDVSVPAREAGWNMNQGRRAGRGMGQGMLTQGYGQGNGQGRGQGRGRGRGKRGGRW